MALQAKHLKIDRLLHQDRFLPPFAEFRFSKQMRAAAAGKVSRQGLEEGRSGNKKIKARKTEEMKKYTEENKKFWEELIAYFP
jgi:hypothetical protein